MTVEIRPRGIACNLQCLYCYQHLQRDAGNLTVEYNMEKMKAAVERAGGHFVLFGGEPLLMSEKDLEEIWSWGLEKYGQNGVQTNGSLINDAHIRLFKRYKVHVGISIDGPEDLNDVRWAGTVKRTREATARTQAAIARLCQEDIPPSLIVTLHRGNATADKLPTMADWLRHLAALSVTSVQLHILEADNEQVTDTLALSNEENLAAFLFLYAAEASFAPLHITLFDEMKRMLVGNDNCTTCVWNACDPYTTRAVLGVEGDGESSGCGRMAKDGIGFEKCDHPGHERTLALYHTPQAYGGCANCRFFLACKGHCPGSAINGDWRNRSVHCGVWKGLFRHLEEEMLDRGEVPLSAHPARTQLETIYLATLERGENPGVATALAQLTGNPVSAQSPSGHGDTHGDHTDARGQSTGRANGHGDHTDGGDRQQGHGDAHGDHTDASGPQTRRGNTPGSHTDRNGRQQGHGDVHGDAPHGDHTDA